MFIQQSEKKSKQMHIGIIFVFNFKIPENKRIQKFRIRLKIPFFMTIYFHVCHQQNDN